MKIALAQTKIFWEDKTKNIAEAEKIIKKQAEVETDLILFPEMSFTGFSMDTDITKEKDDITIRKMCETAIRYEIAIGFGWVKDCGEICENHYSIIDKNGNCLSDYAKIHPFSFSGEDNFFRGGEKITSFELNDIKFSSFICYDLRFPEIFQAVSDEVNAIIIPANWPAKRKEHWKTLLKARAIENQVYILGINCVGNIGGIEYTGDSCIVNPDGEVIKTEKSKEGILLYELKNDTEKYRNNFQMKKDRRWILYQQLYRSK